MKGKIILNLAMSIDGYIADVNGNYNWIKGDGNTNLDTHEKWDFSLFLKYIDIILMGKNCYDEGFHKEFENKKVFVATNKKLKNYDNIYFINENIESILIDEKNKGKNIYLFGGGVTVAPFIEKNLIDEYIIGIIPIILGDGKKLFVSQNNLIELKLTKYLVNEGVVILNYVRR